MKPRLIRIGGIWTCGAFVDFNGWLMRWPLGHGYDPSEAFKDWKAQL